MTGRLQGLGAFDVDAGEFTIGPSEWRRDASAQLDNLTSGSEGGDDPLWHLYNVDRAAGDRVLEVVEDRRELDGMFDVSGQQFLLRRPDGEPLMRFSREGARVGSTTTLRTADGEEVLGSWKVTSLLLRNWEFRDPDQQPRISVKRRWSLGSLFYPEYDLTSADGDSVGRLDIRQDGLFYEADVRLERSTIPTELSLALACGVFWASNQS